MAIMFEERPALSGGHASSATGREHFCPECGQPLSLYRPTALHQPTARRWRFWALLAIGLSLVAVFGFRAALASQVLADREEALRQLPGFESGNLLIARPLDPDRTVESLGDETLLLLDRYAQARSELNRDLVPVGVGLLVVLIGLGVESGEHVRRRLTRF
jgi:hypothetical protein